MIHVVVTWPKSRSLGSYLLELERAKERHALVNFRVPTLPSWPQLIEDHGEKGFAYGTDIRCYQVWDGQVRGWLPVANALFLPDGLVLDPSTGKYWPAGRYLVRRPHWQPINPISMQGFRGWRWFSRTSEA